MGGASGARAPGAELRRGAKMGMWTLHSLLEGGVLKTNPPIKHGKKSSYFFFWERGANILSLPRASKILVAPSTFGLVPCSRSSSCRFDSKDTPQRRARAHMVPRTCHPDRRRERKNVIIFGPMTKGGGVEENHNNTLRNQCFDVSLWTNVIIYDWKIQPIKAKRHLVRFGRIVSG